MGTRPTSGKPVDLQAQPGARAGRSRRRFRSPQSDRYTAIHARYRVLLETAPDAILITDDEGAIVAASRQAEQLFGFAEDALLGSPVERLIPPEFSARHAAHREAFAGDPHTRSMGSGLDLRGLRCDGTEFPVEISLSPSPDGDSLVVAAIRDVSDRVAADEQLKHSEAMLEEAQMVAHVGSWQWDLEADTVIMSDEFYRIFGRTPETLDASFVGIVDCLHPDDFERVSEMLEEALSSSESFDLAYRIVRPDGEVRSLRGRGHAVLGDGGEPVRLVGTVQDVTDLARAEHASTTANLRNQAILEAAGEGIVGLDSDRVITFANRAAAEMTGWSEEDLVGRQWNELISGGLAPGSGESQLDRPSELQLMITERHFGRGDDELFRRPDGSTFVAAFTVAPKRPQDGRPGGTVVTFSDVTSRKRAEAELQYLADHDPVTGLFNRRRFDLELKRQLAYSDRHGRDGAVLLFDLDNFKDTNDTLGHAAGDELLSSVGRLLSERLRRTDVLARFGGDEFAVLLPETNVEQAELTAAELLAEIRDEVFMIGGHQTRLTSSVGVTAFGSARPPEEAAGELMVEADVAMYRAKTSGRDRVGQYVPSDGTKLLKRVATVDRIRRALDQGLLTLWAQPITDLNTGQPTQCEVLVRMEDEAEGLIPPAAFIPPAERAGLIIAIDHWVVEHAITRFAARPVNDRPDGLAVNISGKSIGDPKLLEHVESQLRTSGLDPAALTLEITETAAIANISEARLFAIYLHRLGCRVALDDFGSGFGSFYYLKHIPADFLKIDGDFIRNLPDSTEDQCVVKAIVDIAHGLSKMTIAEFIEGPETLEMAQRWGVDYAQGFYTGRPRPLEELLDDWPDLS